MANRKKLLNSKAGKVIKAGVYTARLPRYIEFFEAHISQQHDIITKQSEDIKTLNKYISDLTEKVEFIESAQENVDKKVSDIKHAALIKKEASSQHKGDGVKSINNTMADDHAHDQFYKDFEDRFRGGEDLITERLQEYNPYLQSLSKAAKNMPALDIGCGRGEFLEVLKQNKLKAVGVDMNKSMVKRAKSLGYEAYENDALSYLVKQKASAFSVITGFHLVEHIPFPVLLKIFEECYRTVHKDGFVLFETPNPNNLTVGASNFYMDPSHIKPIPPKLLAFAMESQGFFTQILELHPAHKDIKHQDPVVEDVMRMVYGPLDYAVLASKKPFKLTA